MDGNFVRWLWPSKGYSSEEKTYPYAFSSLKKFLWSLSKIHFFQLKGFLWSQIIGGNDELKIEWDCSVGGQRNFLSVALLPIPEKWGFSTLKFFFCYFFPRFSRPHQIFFNFVGYVQGSTFSWWWLHETKIWRGKSMSNSGKWLLFPQKMEKKSNVYSFELRTNFNFAPSGIHGVFIFAAQTMGYESLTPPLFSDEESIYCTPQVKDEQQFSPYKNHQWD